VVRFRWGYFTWVGSGPAVLRRRWVCM
jgi:hypothetical protein